MSDLVAAVAENLGQCWGRDPAVILRILCCGFAGTLAGSGFALLLFLAAMARPKVMADLLRFAYHVANEGHFR